MRPLEWIILRNLEVTVVSTKIVTEPTISLLGLFVDSSIGAGEPFMLYTPLYVDFILLSIPLLLSFCSIPRVTFSIEGDLWSLSFPKSAAEEEKTETVLESALEKSAAFLRWVSSDTF